MKTTGSRSSLPACPAFRGRYEITSAFLTISLRPFIPLKGVLKRVPLKGVLKRVPF